MLQLHYFIAFAGIWTLGNGVLHDVFVLVQRRPFDKDLIRLLIDGHILIFAGAVYLLCFKGIQENQNLAFFISVANALFVLGYCALIFKMLPAVGMILINAIALGWLLISFFK